MAKELSLEELQSRLEKEKARATKLAGYTATVSLLVANGSEMHIKEPNSGMYVAVYEDDKKLKKDESELQEDKFYDDIRYIHEEGEFITVEPSLFARMKKQFVEKTIMPVLKKQSEECLKRIEELKEQIAQKQPQIGDSE